VSLLANRGLVEQPALPQLGRLATTSSFFVEIAGAALVRHPLALVYIQSKTVVYHSESSSVARLPTSIDHRLRQCGSSISAIVKDGV